MQVLPLPPIDNASPEALGAFLRPVRDQARRDGRPRLVSITVAVEALDPLAVLESIFEAHEPHFYAERPASETAIAGAEAAASFTASGRDRFAAVQRWIDETLETAVLVGDPSVPFGGAHFFTSFAFGDNVEPGEPFPAAHAFVPCWQVALAGANSTAVANLMVTPDANLEALAERVVRAHRKFSRFEFREVRNSAELLAATGAGVETGFSTTESGDYRQAVARALTFIERGEFSKIVLARAQDLTARRPLHPLRMLNGLRQRFPDCYSFSFTNGTGPSFIGASPERLVRVSKGMVETEALAGSIRRGDGASEDAALAGMLLRSEKDQREQRQVLDDIVSRLRPLGLEPEFSRQPQVRRFANVQHLHTAIRARLPEGVRLLDIVAALHPTPAVGGDPREAAIARLRELEGFPRGLYAGALGWVNARGGGELFVGIRSAIVNGAQARTYAGAGIVAGSTPEKEFAETELKFRAMHDALAAWH